METPPTVIDPRCAEHWHDAAKHPAPSGMWLQWRQRHEHGEMVLNLWRLDGGVDPLSSRLMMRCPSVIG